MASNVGAAISSFMKTEGKKILQDQAKQQLKGAASSLTNLAVGGMGGGRQQQGEVKSRTGLLVGGTLAAGAVTGVGLGPAMAYVGGKMAMGKAQKAATSAASFVSKGATPEAGAALQGTVELAKNQINSFTNLFTDPGIKSIGDFFSVMADSPNQIVSFGEALLSVTGRLKEASATFAQIAATKEIRQLVRDVKTGQQTGESATRLNEAIEDLKDEMLPIQNDLYNTTADLVTDLVPIVSELYQAIAPWLKVTLLVLSEILRFVAGVLAPLATGMLGVFEFILTHLTKIFPLVGLIAGARIDEIVQALKDAKEEIEKLNEEEEELTDPHKIAVQALFGKVDQVLNPPPKPPKP
jgi:hypothetical protein